jgi:hypothetical protein
MGDRWRPRGRGDTAVSHPRMPRNSITGGHL